MGETIGETLGDRLGVTFYPLDTISYAFVIHLDRSYVTPPMATKQSRLAPWRFVCVSASLRVSAVQFENLSAFIGGNNYDDPRLVTREWLTVNGILGGFGVMAVQFSPGSLGASAVQVLNHLRLSAVKF